MAACDRHRQNVRTPPTFGGVFLWTILPLIHQPHPGDDQRRDSRPGRDLRSCKERERRCGSTRDRTEREERTPDADQRAGREADERTTRCDRNERGERRSEDAQLTRLRDGNVELLSDVAEDRRQYEDARLACEQGEEEHDRRRAEARSAEPPEPACVGCSKRRDAHTSRIALERALGYGVNRTVVDRLATRDCREAAGRRQ